MRQNLTLEDVSAWDDSVARFPRGAEGVAPLRVFTLLLARRGATPLVVADRAQLSLNLNAFCRSLCSVLTQAAFAVGSGRLDRTSARSTTALASAMRNTDLQQRFARAVRLRDWRPLSADSVTAGECQLVA